MFLKILIILLIVSLKLSSTSAFFKLFKQSEHEHSRYGVLTAYKHVGNTNITEIIFPGCEAEKIWIFARHGSRYPFKSTMRHLFTKSPEIQQNINNKAGKNIRNWLSLFKFKDHGNLMKSGEEELFEIGKRFRLRFPTLIKKNCHDGAYRYKSTNTQRTKKSAEKFGIGLLGEKHYGKCWQPELKDKSLVLEFYKYCPKWQNDVHHNKEFRREEEKFKMSKIVRKMLKTISKRIGYDVEIGDVKLIGKICAYETAFYGSDRESPWCEILLPEEVKIIEYMNDLYSYWVHGYGHPITYQQACPMLEDMFQFFDSDSVEKFRAYFGHDTGMWKILALLGVAKDKHPLRSDSTKSLKNRKWRSSLISPFASNIAFVSYKCGISQQPSILFLHQEHIVTLPGCPAKKPCPVHTMKQLYAYGQCDFNKWCTE